jgi:hypothetical protein
MRREVHTPSSIDNVSLRDRAASIRWAADRVEGSVRAVELRAFADHLDTVASQMEPRAQADVPLVTPLSPPPAAPHGGA